MPDQYKLFLISISAEVIISSFFVGSQFVQPSLSQGLLKHGQLAGFNATGNQTANQSAGLGDPAKMYVPSQPVD